MFTFLVTRGMLLGVALGFGGTSPALAETSAPVEVNQAYEVARFEFGDGQFVRFVAVGDGVLFEEMGSTDKNPLFHGDNDVLAVYLTLAPENLPVPRAIAAVADEGELERIRGRKIVETLPEPIDLSRDTPLLSFFGHDGQTGTWACSKGADAFREFACEGSGTRVEFCDSGKWHNLRQHSGSVRVKRSLGLFVACGTQVQIRHYYRDCCSDWRKRYETWIPGGHWMSSRYTGGAKWRRQIRYDRVHQLDGSYLRAYTAFY